MQVWKIEKKIASVFFNVLLNQYGIFRSIVSLIFLQTILITISCQKTNKENPSQINF